MTDVSRNAALRAAPADFDGITAAFESWAMMQADGYHLRRRPEQERRGPLGIYSNQRTQYTFEGFVGARGAALDDAAEAAHDTDVATMKWCGQTLDDGAQTKADIIAAIRALRAIDLPRVRGEHEQKE